MTRNIIGPWTREKNETHRYRLSLGSNTTRYLRPKFPTRHLHSLHERESRMNEGRVERERERRERNLSHHSAGPTRALMVPLNISSISALSKVWTARFFISFYSAQPSPPARFYKKLQSKHSTRSSISLCACLAAAAGVNNRQYLFRIGHGSVPRVMSGLFFNRELSAAAAAAS